MAVSAPHLATSTEVDDRIAIEHLALTNFRSYRTLRENFDSRSVVLTGPNGAGKTNVLEALSFLSPGRGLRGAKLSEVGFSSPSDGEDHQREHPWAVAVTLKTVNGTVNLGTGTAPANDSRRIVQVDGDAARGATALQDYLSVVWLTPAMDRLFADGPGGRRRFIDRLVATLDPAHTGRTAAYEQAYRQRLKLLRDDSGDASWFTALEDTMARHGVALAAARSEFITRLNKKLANTSGHFPAARVGLEGVVDEWLIKMPAVDAEDAMRQSLCQEREGPQDAGAGPHRSDISVCMVKPGHASHDQPAARCSTGEQKALLISLILAHAKLQKEQRGHVPILLLDEIVAHLDPDRRSSLFGEILGLGAQAWMTGTDATLFKDLGDTAQFCCVQNKKLTTTPPPR